MSGVDPQEAEGRERRGCMLELKSINVELIFGQHEVVEDQEVHTVSHVHTSLSFNVFLGIGLMRVHTACVEVCS